MADINIGAITEELNNKVDLDGSWGAPSSNYISLTLGSSGSTYTAPADGWVALYGELNSAEIYNETGGNLYWGVVGPNNQWKGQSCPVKKGDVFKVYWSSYGSNINFRFVYAQKTN